MSIKHCFEQTAKKVTGNENIKCKTAKEALSCIAKKACGDDTKEFKSVCDAMNCINEHFDNLSGGGGGSSYQNKVTFRGIVGTSYYQTTINFSELFDSEVSFPLSLYGGWQITEIIGEVSPDESGIYIPCQDYKVKINLEKVNVTLKDYEIALYDNSSGMQDNKEFEIVIEWN